jgi:hypothetical protein
MRSGLGLYPSVIPHPAYPLRSLQVGNHLVRVWPYWIHV